MNKFILTIMVLLLSSLICANSFAKDRSGIKNNTSLSPVSSEDLSGIKLNVDEKPTVEVEDQQTMIKKLNSEQPVVTKTIITPKEEKSDEADKYLQSQSREFINIDAPLNKMMNMRRHR